MTPQEARLLQQAAAVMACHFRGELDERADLVAEFGHDVPTAVALAPRAFTYLSVAAANIMAVAEGRPVWEVLRGLPRRDGDLLHMPVNWPAAVELAIAIQSAPSEVETYAGQMDVPGAVESTFALAIAAVETLAPYWEVTPEQAAQRIAALAARET